MCIGYSLQLFITESSMWCRVKGGNMEPKLRLSLIVDTQPSLSPMKSLRRVSGCCPSCDPCASDCGPDGNADSCYMCQQGEVTGKI